MGGNMKNDVQLYGWRSQLRRQAYEFPLDLRGEARRIRIDEMNRSLSPAEIHQPWMRGFDALKPENYLRETYLRIAEWGLFLRRYIASQKVEEAEQKN